MDRILVVVDMQNDFIDGALGSKEAVGIVEGVWKKIREYPLSDVYYTLDTHGKDYLSTEEGKQLPVTHCVKGTEGHELAPSLKDILAGATKVEKETFGSRRLGELLMERAEEKKDFRPQIEVVGLCTDICVISNVLLLKAFLPQAHFLVDQSLTAGVTPQKKEEALDVLRSCLVEVR